MSQIVTLQTVLSTELRIQILAEISTVQTAIIDFGWSLETTEADLTTLTFPLTEAYPLSRLGSHWSRSIKAVL